MKSIKKFKILKYWKLMHTWDIYTEHVFIHRFSRLSFFKRLYVYRFAPNLPEKCNLGVVLRQAQKLEQRAWNIMYGIRIPFRWYSCDKKKIMEMYSSRLNTKYCDVQIIDLTVVSRIHRRRIEYWEENRILFYTFLGIITPKNICSEPKIDRCPCFRHIT